MIPGGGWWAGIVAWDDGGFVGIASPVVAWVEKTPDTLQAFVARAGTTTAVRLDRLLEESGAKLVGLFPEGGLPTWSQIAAGVEQVRR